MQIFQMCHQCQIEIAQLIASDRSADVVSSGFSQRSVLRKPFFQSPTPRFYVTSL